MLLPKLSELEKAIEKSWIRETSSFPLSWTNENPSWGQCAVTSLVVQDYLGGDLLNCGIELDEEFLDDVKKTDVSIKNPVSHYYNIIEGKVIDLTKRQFSATDFPFLISQGIFKPKDFASTRQYVLSFQKTEERYEILKKRVEKYLIAQK